MMSTPTEFFDEWLASNYHFTKRLSCRLLRSYTNDVYEVLHGNERYILKMYGAGWRAESELHYEAALVKYLVGKGLRMANTIAGVDGKTLHQFDDRF